MGSNCFAYVAVILDQPRFSYNCRRIGSGGFSEWLMQEETPLWSDIFSMVFSIALIPLTISTTWFYLNLVREGNPGIPEVCAIYKDGKTSFKLIGASILQAIFIFYGHYY